jgi:hypothetical protein
MSTGYLAGYAALWKAHGEACYGRRSKKPAMIGDPMDHL